MSMVKRKIAETALRPERVSDGKGKGGKDAKPDVENAPELEPKTKLERLGSQTEADSSTVLSELSTVLGSDDKVAVELVKVGEAKDKVASGSETPANETAAPESSSAEPTPAATTGASTSDKTEGSPVTLNTEEKSVNDDGKAVVEASIPTAPAVEEKAETAKSEQHVRDRVEVQEAASSETVTETSVETKQPASSSSSVPGKEEKEAEPLSVNRRVRKRRKRVSWGAFKDEESQIISRPESEATLRTLKKPKEDPVLLLAKKYHLGRLDDDEKIMDGFFDPGRNVAIRPVEELIEEGGEPFEGQREVLFVDLEQDVALQRLLRQAQTLTSGITDTRTRVLLLSMFVSDSMGGRLARESEFEAIEIADTSFPLSNPNLIQQPSDYEPGSHMNDMIGEFPLSSQMHTLTRRCRRDVLEAMKETISNGVPLGYIQNGLCRHRSILLKVLADRIDPPLKVGLVRGFRDQGTPHAWNTITIDGHKYIIDTLDRPHILTLQERGKPSSPSAGVLPGSDSSDEYVPVYYPQFEMSRHVPQDVGDLHMAVTGRLLGQGTYGEVFECALPHAVCAVKVSQCGALSREDFSLLLSELQVMRELKHRNVVQFLGYVVANGELRLFMEQIKGCSLRGLISERREHHTPLNLAEVCFLALESIKGLRYLHEENILHRDYKSENVLIGTSKSERLRKDPFDPLKPLDDATAVKLCDFNGSMYLQHCYHQNVTYGGTIRWMAPEVLNASPDMFPGDESNGGPNHMGGQFGGIAQTTAFGSAIPLTSSSSVHSSTSPVTFGEAGRASDVWGFGVTLFELLTHLLPYEDMDPATIVSLIRQGVGVKEQLMQVINGESMWPPERNEEPVNTYWRQLVSLTMRCLDADPKARPDVITIEDELKAIIETSGSAVASRPTTLSPFSFEKKPPSLFGSSSSSFSQRSTASSTLSSEGRHKRKVTQRVTRKRNSLKRTAPSSPPHSQTST